MALGNDNDAPDGNDDDDDTMIGNNTGSQELTNIYRENNKIKKEFLAQHSFKKFVIISCCCGCLVLMLPFEVILHRLWRVGVWSLKVVELELDDVLLGYFSGIIVV